MALNKNSAKTDKCSSKPKHCKNKKGDDEKKRADKINAFEDPNNKYLAFIAKKLKNTSKKLKQCAKIQMKLIEGAVVQKEEMEILAKKDKMEFLLETLAEYQFSLKKIASEEINELVSIKKENRQLEKFAEQNYEVKAEKLEKELAQRAKADFEDAMNKKDKEMEDQILSTAKNSKTATINSILELEYSLKFLESIKDDEINILIADLNNNPNDDETGFITPDDLLRFRSLLIQIFPSEIELANLKSARDEFDNSLKTVLKIIENLEDPIDGLQTKYNFRWVSSVAESITKSSLFYNRIRTKLGLVSEKVIVKPIEAEDQPQTSENAPKEPIAPTPKRGTGRGMFGTMNGTRAGRSNYRGRATVNRRCVEN